MRPRRFDRRGFFGRDPDGGIQRFREHSYALSEGEIATALFNWERDRGIFIVVCIGLFAAIPLAYLYDVLTVLFGLCLASGGLFMAVMALAADFRAWQIQQGRFGAPLEYLKHRLPRNMQIMDKERS